MVHNQLESIYRNYDIRGKYPDEIDDGEVTRIGAALVYKFGLKKVAVGRDNRPSADTLFKALTAGLNAMGADVIDLGLVTTPMTYWYCGSTDVDATVMITASHMPAEFNGLKICIEDAKPVTAALLQELRAIVGDHTFSGESKTAVTGKVEADNISLGWYGKFLKDHDLNGANLKVVIDPANMIGVKEITTFRAFAPDLEVLAIYDDLDHTSPNHEANPIKHETLVDLGKAVVDHKADMGVAFDGDADRVGIVDETGRPVPSDLVGALLAKQLLKTFPGSHILFDTRSSKVVPEVISAQGGTPVEWKVGHTNIRTKMRELDAVLGIELAGHFFFKDTYYSEGGPKPALLLLELLKASGYSLSQHVAEIKKYHHSGEVNSEIKRSPEQIYADLVAEFPDGEVSDLDGLKIVYPNWWFNVRPSANDPVLRLNLEADDKAVMEEKMHKVLKIVRR